MSKSIKISEKTYERLCSVGLYRETFDEIIQRLLEAYQLAERARKGRRRTKGNNDRTTT